MPRHEGNQLYKTEREREMRRSKVTHECYSFLAYLALLLILCKIICSRFHGNVFGSIMFDVATVC